jgi:hypothetical protein
MFLTVLPTFSKLILGYTLKGIMAASLPFARFEVSRAMKVQILVF